ASTHSGYLDFLACELERVQHHGVLFAAQDFAGTFAIIQTIRDGRDKPLSDILHQLSLHFLNFDPPTIRRSLELSLRLWLTISIPSSDIHVGPVFAGERSIEWDANISLDTLLRPYFISYERLDTPTSHIKIDPAFTVAYLVNTCGLRLRWTDNIAEHLKLDLGRVSLTVYRHKICLIYHLNDQQSFPISGDLLEEMLDTVNLLFPFGDAATKQLLSKEGQRSMYSLGSCNRSRKIELNRYRYFREELEHLIDFFQGSPRTWKQLAFDRRNKLEWSAFWVGVMGTILALVSLISLPCTIIQTIYSIKAYNLAVAQERNGLGAG
ncbi:hypothetical protein EK21DRAFT_80376, partial [Setomelanomma holmii]